MLTFASKPNFEVPGNHECHSERFEHLPGSRAGLRWRDDEAHLNWFKVTVTVTDVDEDGKVTWTVITLTAIDECCTC